MKQLQTISKDLIFLTILILFGWFLIGFYLQGETLATGYQDWMSHAYRIQELQQHGLASWNFRWSNGISIWRSYQFVPHYIAIGVMKVAHVSITKAMIYEVVGVFLLLRFLMYVLLRRLGISPFASFVATMISYDFSQQWQVMKDFTIHTATLAVPLYLYLWLRSVQKKSIDYILSVYAGSVWFLHPVIGFFASSLFFLKQFLQFKDINKKALSIQFCLFLFPFILFIAPILAGHYFSNPIFKSSEFIRQNLPYDYLGASITYYLLFFVSFATITLLRKSIGTSYKMLFAALSFLLGLLMFGKLGYTPSILNQFQFGRINTSIALSAPFVFAIIIDAIRKKTQSVFVLSLILIALVASIFNAIEIGSAISGSPIRTVEAPVKKIDGLAYERIYFPNDSEAVFGTDDTLFTSGSYMAHQLPNPLSFRYTSLLQSRYSGGSISSYRRKLISSYSTVLNVSYAYVPFNSPIAKSLSNDSAWDANTTVDFGSARYVVLKNRDAQSDAYIVDADSFKDNGALEKPTLESQSYVPWDREVIRIASLLQNKRVVPLKVSYSIPETMSIQLGKKVGSNSIVYTNQNFDEGWSVQQKGVFIKPNTIGQITLVTDSSFSSDKIDLIHKWPSWYVVVSSVGHLIFIGSLLIAISFVLKKP